MRAAEVTFLGYSGKSLKCQSNQDVENITTIITYSYITNVNLHLHNRNQVNNAIE